MCGMTDKKCMRSTYGSSSKGQESDCRHCDTRVVNSRRFPANILNSVNEGRGTYMKLELASEQRLLEDSLQPLK